MASSSSAEDKEPSRRVRRRHESQSGLDGEKLYKSRGNETVTLQPDEQGVRRFRIERLEGRTSASTLVGKSPLHSSANMTEGSIATPPGLRSTPSHRRRRDSQVRPEEKKHRAQKKSSTKEDDRAEYVYGPPTGRPKSSRITISETRKLGRDGETSESEEDRDTQSEPVREKGHKEKKIRVIYISKEEAKSSRHKEKRVKPEKERSECPRDPEESVRRSRTHRSRRNSIAEVPASPPKRSTSTRHLTSDSRPSLQRSNTTSSAVPSSKGPYPPSVSTNSTHRRSSFLGSFLRPSAPSHHEPERTVECLTCLDDVPRSKSAKLKCGHRMCHSCLRRIFKLSVVDPQHMPPKCCTADHIPLKHVEKLFDINFKKTWNRKFQEYTTKNRIYCPARRCGEWIKPGNIHKENGVKYGKCSRCKTKVCCQCNGKWHGSKDCPKDEETNRLLETAKQSGWQRCYNCRTMVELKEGCNHMTCRCNAEFCMVCGLKWKSCNCPWFNYEAVEEDRLNHVQIPQEVRVDSDDETPVERPRRLRRHRPNTYYHEEMTDRQRQERRDEAIARRMQRELFEGAEDYQGGIDDFRGVGNGAGYFMDQDYIRAAQNILTGNYDQATAAANYVMGVSNARGIPPPQRMADRYPVPMVAAEIQPPLLRRHTMREQAYNSAQTRPAERVLPRRSRTDYAAEAAVHAPVGRAPERVNSRREQRPSVLAGLGGTARGGNRVDAWRTHIELGVVPDEGVLSVV